jgi:hypothetical protein
MSSSAPNATGPRHTDHDDLRNVELPLHPNEASGMALVTDEELMDRLGWSLGFWVCLDEGPVERCVALIGHPADSRNPNEWEIRRLHGQVQYAAGSTEDCESVAVWDGWVYVFGSQFGSKEGPLERERQFVARFRESDVEPSGETIDVAMQLWEAEFALHRLINDALRTAAIDLLPLGNKTRKAFVHKARKKAIKKASPWLHQIRHDDVMVNVEGAAFLGDGTLVLGLRQPVTGDGHPLIVALDGIGEVFTEGPDALRVRTIWTVENLGRRDEHVGIRDLSAYDYTLDLLVGNAEAVGSDSVFLSEHPEGGRAVSTHCHVNLSDHADGGGVTAEFVRGFGNLKRVEGIAAAPSGEWFYVSDEDDHVQTRFTMGGWHIDDEEAEHSGTG